MGHLLLKQDGTIEHHFVIEDEDGEFLNRQETLEKDAELIPFFCYDIKLDEQYTLRSFFKTLEVYPQLQLIDGFLPEYVEQVRDFKNKHEIHNIDDEVTDMDHIAVHYTTKVDVIDCEIKMEKFPEIRGNNTYYRMETTRIPKNKLSVSSDYHVDCYAKSKDENDTDTYSITFISPVKMLHLPIKLKTPKTTFMDILETHSLGDITPIVCYEDKSGFAGMTLYDFIYAIAEEMCFHGSPEDTQGILEELKRRADEVNQDYQIDNKDDKNQ